MRRKIGVVVLAMLIAVAFAATMAVAADPPGEMTIDKVASKKVGVPFTHEKHSGSIDCFKCHHASKTKEEIKSCFECHGKDANAPDPTSSKTDNPFHTMCKGCHKEQGQGPTKCADCHKE
ncbi:MAG: cytochrome c3 family protein [bacterium]|nr:MAG: cytochrome c3 family protein [bacterium]